MTSTGGLHVATVRQFNPITGVATVVIPALYGDTAVESRPFLSTPAEASQLPILDPGDTVIAFYDGGDSTTILRWYLTGGHGVGAVAPTAWPVVLYNGTSWPPRGVYPSNMSVLWVNHYDQTKPPFGVAGGAVINVDIVFLVDENAGAGGTDEVWVGPVAPTDPAVEMWFNPVTGALYVRWAGGWVLVNPPSAGGGLPPGGAANQVLAKLTSADGVTYWADGALWQIKTVEPPLYRGDTASAQSSQPQAFIELDRLGIGDTTVASRDYQQINFHPLTQYGPIWYSSNQLMAVNPGEYWTGLVCNLYGDLSFYIADQWFYYGGTNYEQVIPSEGVTLDDSNYMDYKRDWHENYNGSTDISVGGMRSDPEHWVSYHYQLPPGHASAPLPPSWVGDDNFGGSDSWYYLETDYFEFGSEGVCDWPDYECEGGFWFSSPERDSAYTAETSRFEIWNKLTTSSSASGFGSPYKREEFHFGVDCSMIYVADGFGVGLVGGDRRRGNVPVLQSVNEAHGTQADSIWKQYYGQVGEENVMFTSGVGSVTTIEKMGDGNRHVQASIVGTTVGGPMVAQVDSPDQTHINFYLNTTHTGTLKVSWSAQFQEPTWSTTQPVMGYVYVGYQQWGTLPGQISADYEYHALNHMTVLIPWTNPGMTIRILMHGGNIGSGTKVYDSAGTERGTVSAQSSTSFIWDVQSDLYPLNTTEYFHTRQDSGERSNTWRMRWAYGPVPPPVPAGMMLLFGEEEAEMRQQVIQQMTEEEPEDRRQMRRERRDWHHEEQQQQRGGEPVGEGRTRPRRQRRVRRLRPRPSHEQDL